MADHSARLPFHGTRSAPIVGRSRERALLRDRLDGALAGRGGLVLIGGEAGIGKTALAEALCAEAADQGALVLVGRCYDLTETPPYGPWTEAFASLIADRDAARLPAPLGDGEVVASQAALFAAVRDQLGAVTARQPLVLLLDDLHWADPASLDLLRTLARQGSGWPLLPLVTYRADELSRRHPLYQLLPLLVREAQATQLDLRPLPEEAVRDLVRARYALPSSDEDRLASYLRERAAGHPFFLGELLKTIEEVGDLDATGDGWRLGDLGALRVPRLLRQVVEGRLARLPDEDQRLLAVAAVLGQEVPLALWASVADVGEDALLETTERAAGARLLEEAEDGARARFVHALVREALYEGTLPSRRRAWHRRAGEALAATAAPDPDAVAHHFRQGGDVRAATWLARAGHRARRAHAYRTAAERYEAALALAAGRDADASDQGWLLYFLARARYYDDPRGGIAHLEEVARLAAAAEDRALWAEAHYWLGFYLSGSGDHRRGIAAMVAGMAALDDLDATERARLAGALGGQRPYAGTLALRLTNVGRYAEARTLVSDTAAHVDDLNAIFTLVQAHAVFGQVAEARIALERGLAGLRSDGDLLSLGLYLLYMLHSVVVPYQADQLEVREGIAAEAEQTIARAGGLTTEESPQLGRLPLLMLEGRWADAHTTALAHSTSVRHSRFIGAGLLASLARAQGDTATAAALIREWLPAGTAEEPGGTHYQHSLAMQRLAAALAIDAGDLPTAQAWLAAHDRWLDWSGAILGLAEGALGWANYHREAGNPRAAREYAERALGHASDPRQPLAILASHRTLGELATDAGSHADAATHLDAALALADACAAPYERALTLLALAELRAATGQRAATQELLDEARAILEPLAARPALARAEALRAKLAPAADPVYPAKLTAREVEVLRLVAQGLTDIQVAERLYVSANTVKTHLRSIYNKLDVTSRTAAARFATDHGLA